MANKKYNSNINLKFDDIYWLIIDDIHAEPVIFNDEKTKMKCILTGQVLGDKAKLGKTALKRPFAFDTLEDNVQQELMEQKNYVLDELNCNSFHCGDFENICGGILHDLKGSINTLDMMKSKIAKNIFDDLERADNNPYTTKYSLKDYEIFQKILNTKLAKIKKRKQTEKDNSTKSRQYVKDNMDFTKF